MMSVVEKDPAALKLSVLLLMLHHPDGIKFGDFSGAFQQLHGYHPQLSLYGYHSLRDLLAEMKDVVVLEGDSQNLVIKTASDLDLDQWLEENRWDDCEEETQSSFDDDEEAEVKEEAEAGTEVLELLTSLLSTYKAGLRIEKVQEFLLVRHGVHLEMFSIAQGYKDTLDYLEHQLPELTIHYREDRLKCVAQLTAEEMQPSISSSSCKNVQASDPHAKAMPASKKVLQLLTHRLSNHKSGLRIEKLQEYLLTGNGMDLEKYSIAQGYKDTLEFLEHQMPELAIYYKKNRLKCVVWLMAGTTEKMQPPASCSSCKELQELMATVEGDPVALKHNVLHLLLRHPEGVKFGNFSGAFHQLHGYHPQFALHGYRSLRDLLVDMKDVVVLEGDSQNPVIKVARDLDLYQCLEGEDDNRSDDSEGKVQSLSCEAAAGEDAGILMLLPIILSRYKHGLKIKMIQKILLDMNCMDLEKFSIAQGYKDTLEFLEHRMPGLTIQYKENRLKCTVRLTAGTAEKMQPSISSSSCKKVSHTGLAISSSYPPPLQDLPLDSSKTAQNLKPRTDMNTIQNRTDPPSINDPIPQLQEPDATVEGDPAALKRNVIHLVLQHPEGVKFGDFSGAFQQLHGYPPKLSLHGYRSLRDLVADMKSFVVLEGGSQDPVIKIASDSHLYQWLEGGEENGWGDSEGKTQSFSCEAAAGEDADISSLSPSAIAQDLVKEPATQEPEFSIAFVAVRNVLKCQPKGLKVKKLKEALRKKYNLDLERLRSGLGYKDIVSFLQDMPGLLLRNSSTVRNCVVQLQSGSSSPAPSLDTDFSACNSNATFQEPMRKESELFQVGCQSSARLNDKYDQISPKWAGLPVHGNFLFMGTSWNGNYLLPCHSNNTDWCNGTADTAECTQSPTPSLDTDFCVIPESQMTKKSDLTAALMLVLDVLGGCPLGLNLKALKENLETKHGFDLDAFSQGLGYEDVTSCLLDIPGLGMTYHRGKQSQDCTVQLLSGGPVLPAHLLSTSHSLDKPPSSSGSNTLHQKPMERKPDPCVSTSAKVSLPLSFASKESSIRSETLSQRKVEKKPTLAEILALISSLLSSKGYEMGLRVEKVQELLLRKEEVDLEKFSIAQGHKDSLAFLECHMPELKIRYEENRLSCVLHLGSDSCIPDSIQVSAPLSLDSEESSIKSELSTQRKAEKKPAALEEVLAALSSLLSIKEYVLGLRLQKVQKLLMTKEGIDLDKFSIAQGYKDSLAFLECHMPELKISYQEDRLKCLIQLGSGSYFSTSTQANSPPSFDSKQSSIKSETPSQRKMGKKPALEEVLALLSSLLSSKPYQSGLKLKKVQELLLTKEGFDLENFSIAQGYKDSLAFVECHMLEHCLIRYQEDRLSCVLQLQSGFGSISKHLPTSRDSSANRPWIQSLSAPSTAITPVSQGPHGTILVRDESPSQPHSGISAQLSSECQLRRTPPAEELPSLSDAQQLRRSNLTGPHHSKDLDELKQEVAHILAGHPEGVSLFQFRAEYSAAFQKHLLLGNASSAKQCLLQMPDVVCLKGYGVQTLLFPVSSKESSLKTRQQIMSRVEDAMAVPGRSVSEAVADPVPVLQPSLPTVPVRPQPHTIYSLTSGPLGEPGKAEISVLPQSVVLEAPRPRALLQEDEVARAKLGYRSGLSYLADTADAAAARGYSLSETDPVVVPKSSAPKAGVAPVPPSHPFPHLYSECFKPLSNKETCPGLEASPQRPPKTAPPEEEQAKTRARPRRTHSLPPSAVVFPSDWGEMSGGFASKPTHLAKPQASVKRTPAPSPFQPLPANFMTWAQPLVFPPVMFLTPLPPASASVHNAPRIQPQNVAYQSSVPQALPQMRPAQPTSPLHRAEQRNYVYVAQGPGAFSQEQMSSRTVMHAQSQAPVFAMDGLPVSSPPHNPSSSYAFRSQTYHQTECYHHPWLDGPQCRSTTTVHSSIMTTPSARAPSQPAAYWNQSVGGNPFVASPSAAPSSLSPDPTRMPQETSSSHICTLSDALASSDLRASPHPLESRTLSNSNRDPQVSVYPQQYADGRPTISSVTTRPNSSPASPVYSTQTSGQPSYTSYNSTTDYGSPDHMRSLMATSKEAEKQDNHYVTWVDKQKPPLTQRPTVSYSSAFQNRPPPKSPGKCVIL